MAKASGGGVDVGYFAIPIIPSFEGIESKINDGLSGKFVGPGRKAGGEIGKGIAAGITEHEAAVKSALDRYTSLYNRHADTLGKVRVEQAKLEDLKKSSTATDTRILAQNERLEAAKRKETQALKLASDAQKAYNASKKQHVEEERRSGEAFHKSAEHAEHLFGVLSKTTGAFGPLGSAMSGVAGGATEMGGGLLSAAAAGGAAGAAVALFAVPLEKIVEIGPELVEKLYDIGESFNEMSNKASFATGLTGESLGKLTSSVEAVAGHTPGTLEQIGSVATSLTRNLHLTGDELEELTESITNLNIKSGEAVNIRGLTKAFHGFGIEAGQQNDALNQLYTISTQTGFSVNELIDSVGAGGATLREFGLTFGQTAALMANFEKAGISGDKMVVGLRKTLGAFAKEGKDPKKALEDLIKQMHDLTAAGNDDEALNIANKLFGKKGGVDFFDAVKRGKIDLDTFADGFDGTTLSINEMAEKTEDAGEKWQILKNKMDIALEPIATKIFDIGQSGLEDLTQWVDTHHAAIIHFFQDIGVAGIEAFRGIALVMGPTLQVLAAAVNAFDWLSKHTGGAMGAVDLGDFPERTAQLGESLSNLAAPGGGADQAANRLRALGNAAADAEKLSDALSGSVHSLKAEGENVTINIKDNTPEVREKLDAMHVHLEEIANDPTHLKIVPDTPEAKEMVDAFRRQETGDPLPINIKPEMDPNAFRNLLTDILSGQAGSPMPSGGGAPPGVPDLLPGMSGPGGWGPGAHARGAVDVWDRVASFAAGGMPDQAIIQHPVAPAGLVQWAEPSTHGEAYIPLAPSNRERSQKILAEAASRIGMGTYKMDTGGIVAYDRAIAEAMSIGDGRTYDYGGTGPNFDCSGAQSDIYAVMTGKPVGTRYFDTESNFEALGFKRGFMPGAWNIGIHHGGGGMNSHMASTLPNGVNFESGGKTNKTMYGRGAAGANDPQFGDHWYLAVGGNPVGQAGGAGGGEGGGGSFNAAGYYTGGGGGGGGGAGGTPGIGPGGEAGRYVADPKRVREAEERVSDADTRVKESEDRLKELKADAKQSERDAAQHNLDKAKREADDARSDLAEAQQGKFEKDKTGKGEKGGKGESEKDGGIGKIFGDAFTETLGLDGSVFPDIKNLGIVKLFKAIMGIKYNPVGDGSFAGGLLGGGGAAGGSDPFAGGGDAGGGGGAGGLLSGLLSLPFGMIPDASAPGPPAGDAGMPAAAEGAKNFGPIDQSTNVHLHGTDAKDVTDQAIRGVKIAQRQRVATYEPPGLPG